MSRIRILIADDHAVLRAGLTMLLNSQEDMQVIGEAADGEAAVSLARQLTPDIVLMDLGMSGLSGLEATRAIVQAQLGTRVLVLTMHDDPAFLRSVLQAGAAGYVLKRAADVELLAAIRAVQRGEIYIHPAMTKPLLEDIITRHEQRETSARKESLPLSERELQVLRLIAAGYTRQQIAERLHLSVKTVETYKARVMEKLHLETRAELVRYALQKGLLDDETRRQENT